MRLLYFSRKTYSSLRANPTLSVVTIGTIGAALFVVGAYISMLQNLESLSLSWGRSANITVYIEDTINEPGWNDIRANIEQRSRSHSAGAKIKSAVLVTPTQMLERFRIRGPQQAVLVEGVSADVLPAAVEIRLGTGFATLENVEALALELQKVKGVSEVDYGREEFSRLQSLLEVLRLVGLGIGFLLALATSFIIGNTIRLAIYARRDEISILELVGATPPFIRAPFLMEGSIWGFLGGVMASLGLYLWDILLGPYVNTAVADLLGGFEIQLFLPVVAMGIVLLGCIIGFMGSALALRRFMHVPGASGTQ